MLHQSSNVPQMTSNNQHDATNNLFNINQPPPNHQLWNTSAQPLNNMSTQHSSASNGNNSQSLALNFTAQIEALNMQQNTLREQIHQSESNLTAQHTVNFFMQS